MTYMGSNASTVWDSICFCKLSADLAIFLATIPSYSDYFSTKQYVKNSSVCSWRFVTGQITSKDRSRTFVSLRRDERFGERDNSDDDWLGSARLMCDSRSLRLEGLVLELLLLHRFDLFGHWNLHDERLFCLVLSYFEPSCCRILRTFALSTRTI